MNTPSFNLEKIKLRKCHYVIGIDTYDKEVSAYCLIRVVDDDTEIILSKTIKDEKKFKEEVDNLAKYFNAFVYE